MFEPAFIRAPITPLLSSKLTRCLGLRWRFLPHLLPGIVRSECSRTKLHRISESSSSPERHRNYRTSGPQLHRPLCRRAQPFHRPCRIHGFDHLSVVYRNQLAGTICVDCVLQLGDGWHSVTWSCCAGSREVRCTEARDSNWHGLFCDCLRCAHRAPGFGSLGKRGWLAWCTALRGDLHDGRSSSSGCCTGSQEETQFNGCVGKIVDGEGLWPEGCMCF